MGRKKKSETIALNNETKLGEFESQEEIIERLKQQLILKTKIIICYLIKFDFDLF